MTVPWVDPRIFGEDRTPFLGSMSAALITGFLIWQVALRWVAQQDLPVVVLSSSSAHLQSNRDAVAGTWR